MRERWERCSSSGASDWIYILLADSQHSPVPLCSKERTGSPVGIRTYDPVVNNAQVNCFVFSRTLLSHAACRGMRKLLSGRESSVFRQRIRRVLLAFSWCCDGKCGAMCCSCQRSCAWACKGFFL